MSELASSARHLGRPAARHRRRRPAHVRDRHQRRFAAGAAGRRFAPGPDPRPGGGAARGRYRDRRRARHCDPRVATRRGCRVRGRRTGAVPGVWHASDGARHVRHRSDLGHDRRAGGLGPGRGRGRDQLRHGRGRPEAHGNLAHRDGRAVRRRKHRRLQSVRRMGGWPRAGRGAAHLGGVRHAVRPALTVLRPWGGGPASVRPRRARHARAVHGCERLDSDRAAAAVRPVERVVQRGRQRRVRLPGVAAADGLVHGPPRPGEALVRLRVRGEPLVHCPRPGCAPTGFPRDGHRRPGAVPRSQRDVPARRAELEPPPRDLPERAADLQCELIAGERPADRRPAHPRVGARDARPRARDRVANARVHGRG